MIIQSDSFLYAWKEVSVCFTMTLNNQTCLLLIIWLHWFYVKILHIFIVTSDCPHGFVNNFVSVFGDRVQCPGDGGVCCGAGNRNGCDMSCAKNRCIKAGGKWIHTEDKRPYTCKMGWFLIFYYTLIVAGILYKYETH